MLCSVLCAHLWCVFSVGCAVSLREELGIFLYFKLCVACKWFVTSWGLTKTLQLLLACFSYPLSPSFLLSCSPSSICRMLACTAACLFLSVSPLLVSDRTEWKTALYSCKQNGHNSSALPSLHSTPKLVPLSVPRTHPSILQLPYFRIRGNSQWLVSNYHVPPQNGSTFHCWMWRHTPTQEMSVTRQIYSTASEFPVWASEVFSVQQRLPELLVARFKLASKSLNFTGTGV